MSRAFGHIIALMTVLLTLSACQPDVTDKTTSELTSETVDFDLNDVSILLPPPTTAGTSVLPIADLDFGGSSVWPDEAFAQFLAIAQSEASPQGLLSELR